MILVASGWSRGAELSGKRSMQRIGNGKARAIGMRQFEREKDNEEGRTTQQLGWNGAMAGEIGQLSAGGVRAPAGVPVLLKTKPIAQLRVRTRCVT